MFSLRLSHADHMLCYSIVPIAQLGWEVRVTEDNQLREQRRHLDWQRVEFTMALFEREARMLESRGWRRHDPDPGVAWRRH